MDRQIDPPVEQFALDLFRENARAGHRTGGGLLLVAAGRDLDQFDFQAALAKLRRHPVGLPLGQQARASA